MRRSLVLLLLSISCIDTAPLPEVDGAVDLGVDAPPPPPPEVSSLVALDHGGREWPLSAMPRQPIVEVRATADLESDAPFLFVFRGALDLEELDADLRRTPLLARHEALALPVEASGMRFAPPPLEPGESYTLAVAGWARSAAGERVALPYLAHARVAATGAGARVSGSWPADGTAGVPYALPLIAVRFDDLVRGDDLHLMGPDGEVRTTLSSVACASVGWEDGDCRALDPDGPLRPGREYRIEVGSGVSDRGGAPVGPWSATFRTGDEASRPLGFLTTECALDETAVGPACVLADDRSAVVRLAVDAPVRAFLSAAGREVAAIAERGEVRLVLDSLSAGQTVDARLRLVGLGGEGHTELFAFALPADLAPLTLAEVRANPLGPEPRQEYVEVLNSSSAPVSVEGLALSDRPDRIGDVIPSAQMIPPGARALLVADAFDPDDERDVPVPPGALLIRVGTSLASAGLTNAGEALYLRDGAGRRLGASPAIATDGGECLVRLGDGRAGDAELFTVGACTPGRAP